jgi:hypothetical protein
LASADSVKGASLERFGQLAGGSSKLVTVMPTKEGLSSPEAGEAGRGQPWLLMVMVTVFENE